MKKVVLKTLIITFIINAILGISIIILNLWNDITSKILLTTVTIFGFSIPCLICSTNYEKAKNKLIPIIGDEHADMEKGTGVVKVVFTFYY